jgi:hypothetical protein
MKSPEDYPSPLTAEVQTIVKESWQELDDHFAQHDGHANFVIEGQTAKDEFVRQLLKTGWAVENGPGGSLIVDKKRPL